MGKIIYALFLIIFLNCYFDVPHNSKYDKKNPFGVGSLNISVYSLASNPLDEVRVLINDTIEFITDKTGKLSNIDIFQGDLSISFNKTGYKGVLIDTFVEIGDKFDFQVYMNYIPEILSGSVHSSVKKKHDIIDTLDYHVVYDILVHDKDGQVDMDSVVLRYNSESYKCNIVDIKGDTLHYNFVFNDDENINIFDLEGAGINAFAFDKNGEYDSINNLILIRFIHTIIDIENPINGEFFELPDTIKWSMSDINYSVRIELEIIKDQESVLKIENLTKDTRQYVIDSLMFSGEYDLYMRIFDVYNNYSENSIYFIVP